MARSVGTKAAASDSSVLAGGAAAAANNMGYSIQTPDLVETRVGSRKVMLPKRITGTESAATMNLIYHTTLASLRTNCTGIGAANRMTGLCAVMGQDAIGSTVISAYNNLINQALKDPTSMIVQSYHKINGAVVGNDCLARRGGNVVLKPVGLPDTASAAIDRRGNGIKFVCVVVEVDLEPILGKEVLCRFDSFFELAQGRQEILDGNGVPFTANTWLGPDVITDMSPEDFKTLCLDHTRQHGAADLVESSFATTNATLTYGDK